MVTKTVGDLYRGAPYMTRTLVVLLSLVSGLLGVLFISHGLLQFFASEDQAILVVTTCIGSVLLWFPVGLALVGRAGRPD